MIWRNATPLPAFNTFVPNVTFMSDVIRLLPDSVANQIAAGEVIQRPASVIKELVENAVDAGAQSIKIILRDGGKNLIQIIDDGCGMSDTDARLAFERHATSKIKQASDLFDLHTMGFRGEALPSIAAVAQIDLRTMRRDAPIGTHLEIAASRFESQQPDACQPGTNISVKNLFFNFPARRKFLKKDSVELTHIIHEFERLALVNPGKEFLLVHNDVTLHQLLPGSLKQRIVDLFGKALQKQLIPVETETSLVKISGFVASPECTRKRNALQFFFVNGRNMRHPYFQKAVLHCYEDLIPADHQPNFFLNFEVDPATIDVNIHPTKSEIKFENETPIWQILVAAIKESMGKFNVVPSIDFDQADSIEIPAFNQTSHGSAKSGFSNIQDATYNPFAPTEQRKENGNNGKMQQLHPSGLNRQAALSDWEKLYEGFTNDRDTVSPTAIPAEYPDSGYSPFNTTPDEYIPEDFSDSSATLNSTRESIINSLPQSPATNGNTPTLPDMNKHESAGFMQLRNKYILIPSHNGVLLIDRHRAHLKVLYEQFIQTELTAETQQVLFPETLTLSPALNVVMESMTDITAKLGFDLSYLGNNVWAINGIPSSIGKLNPTEVLGIMVENVAEATLMPEADLRHRVALSMAYATAVTPSRQLSDAEIEILLSKFLSLPDPAYTPDGHQTFITISYDEMARRLS